MHIRLVHIRLMCTRMIESSLAASHCLTSRSNLELPSAISAGSTNYYRNRRTQSIRREYFPFPENSFKPFPVNTWNFDTGRRFPSPVDWLVSRQLGIQALGGAHSECIPLNFSLAASRPHSPNSPVTSSPVVRVSACTMGRVPLHSFPAKFVIFK